MRAVLELGVVRMPEVGVVVERDLAVGSAEFVEAIESQDELDMAIDIVRRMKKIAKEMGRPIITAEHGGWGGRRVFVTIKKLKRNEVIVAPFLLFKVELHRRSKVDGPIVLFNDKTNHYLQFFGPKGIAAYHKWAEQCRADEAFRKAMKLDIAITHNLEK